MGLANSRVTIGQQQTCPEINLKLHKEVVGNRLPCRSSCQAHFDLCCKTRFHLEGRDFDLFASGGLVLLLTSRSKDHLTAKFPHW